MNRYRPPHANLWQGREDEGNLQRLYQVINMVDLNEPLPSFPKGTIAFLGFACDEGIKRNKGRPGANEGPHAIRLMLAKLPLSSQGKTFIDAGNIVCVDNDLEKSQEALADAVALLLANNCVPFILGGGHELAWGHYLGLKKADKHRGLAIINFDAHYDLRPLVDDVHGSSGTSFAQIATDLEKEEQAFNYTCIGIQASGNTPCLKEAAKALAVTTITAEEIFTQPHEVIKNKVEEIVSNADSILLSICMDVFAAPYAPGVSAPQPAGLTPWQVIPLLQMMASSNKILSIEIAEVSPPLDCDDATSRLAANLTYHLI